MGGKLGRGGDLWGDDGGAQVGASMEVLSVGGVGGTRGIDDACGNGLQCGYAHARDQETLSSPISIDGRNLGQGYIV